MSAFLGNVFRYPIFSNESILFLQHDNYNECCTVEHTDRGVRLKNTFKLIDVL